MRSNTKNRISVSDVKTRSQDEHGLAVVGYKDAIRRRQCLVVQISLYKCFVQIGLSVPTPWAGWPSHLTWLSGQSGHPDIQDIHLSKRARRYRRYTQETMILLISTCVHSQTLSRRASLPALRTGWISIERYLSQSSKYFLTISESNWHLTLCFVFVWFQILTLGQLRFIQQQQCGASVHFSY